MDAKETLRQKFSAGYKKYYEVALFKEKGFVRQQCKKCGRFFWALTSRKTCPDPECEPYGFIGKPLQKNVDYIRTWKTIERFFVKHKHTSVNSYPVVCRWFPGLYYTVASIVAFQRSVNGRTVFEFPSNPLIIPQQCLRFNDIPNVGITGRHNTNFTMIGQHSLYDQKQKQGYWKDRCIEIDYQLLTGTLKIPPEDVAFTEDVWLGPNAFGYSLEYFVKGLELGNAVFTEFLGTPESYSVMDKKIVDMGAGLEHITWLLSGAPTAYDVIYGPMMQKLKKKVSYDAEFFERYARLAGSLDIENTRDIKAVKKSVASQLGVTVDALQENIGPLEAVYVIADHSRTLLYAISDGLLPSNVGGGYNLRVVLRRALSFISQYKIDTDLYELCTQHAAYLKKMRPELRESLGEIQDILATEQERFESTKQRGKTLIEALVKKQVTLDEKKLAELYESHGITPELIEHVAGEMGTHISIPVDFYRTLSKQHEKEKVKAHTAIDLAGLPPTELLFYKNHDMREFRARVLAIVDGKYVVLDKSAFYGRAAKSPTKDR